MNTKILFPVCCLLLGACAKTPPNIPSPVSEHNSTYVALGEAASSVSKTLTELGQTEQAAYPPQSISEPPSPESYGMAMTTSIDWEGPVQPLVRQIANASNYKLRVLGNAPSIPVIVTVVVKNTPMGEILRNVGYQCKNRATIVVFPSSRIIELRYAKS